MHSEALYCKGVPPCARRVATAHVPWIQELSEEVPAFCVSLIVWSLFIVAEITRIIDEYHVSIERLDSITTSAERFLRAFVMMLNSDSISRLEDCVRAMQGVVSTLNTIISSFEDTFTAEPYGWYLPLSVVVEKGHNYVSLLVF